MPYRLFLWVGLLASIILASGCNNRSRGGRMPVADTGTPPPADGSVVDTSVPPADSSVDTTPPPGCVGPADCNDGLTCTDDLCESGTCRNVPNDGLCEPGMTCELGAGCTGFACDESPCRLLSPQCGCAPGQGCYPSGGGRACMTAGTRVEGSSCTESNECEPGSICAGIGVASCHRTCRTDVDCPGATNLCVLEFEDGVTDLCSGTCDPIAQTGCPSGAMCRVFQEDDGARRGFTACWGPVGSGIQGSSCSDSNQCARGYVCGGTICHKWCRVGFAGDCLGGTTCGALETPITVGSIRYDLCI